MSFLTADMGAVHIAFSGSEINDADELVSRVLAKADRLLNSFMSQVKAVFESFHALVLAAWVGTSAAGDVLHQQIVVTSLCSLNCAVEHPHDSLSCFEGKHDQRHGQFADARRGSMCICMCFFGFNPRPELCLKAISRRSYPKRRIAQRSTIHT